ncbi:MAG TPA: DUF1592 domain-containing protein [Povalibacter sp.]|nr:DUF1592 domain-containing protein [Povalibacter sp.]
MHSGHIEPRLRAGLAGVLAVLALSGCSPSEPQSSGTEPRISLVTTDQYLNSLRYIFGSGIELQVQFPPFERTEGLLANGAAIAGISSSQLEQFQGAGATVAAQVVDGEHREFLVSCKPAADDSADEACATEFLSKIGRLLYRRPLTDTELATFVDSAGSGAKTLKDFYAGLELALEAMLLSPEVLFVVERAEPDPDNPGQLRLDAYSLASRLSYFLWDAGPDDELLNAAASGELQTKKGLARTVDRMLASPRLADGMRAFFDDMFGFNAFRTVAKDSTIYPNFTSVTAEAAREQTLRTVINHLVVENKDYRDLFTTRSSFMTPALAILEGTPALPGWTPYTLPSDSHRVGLLTQVSFLSLHAHPGRSSPTLRGQALREVLLCQHVPEPPPGVDFSIVNSPSSSYPTQRDRVNAHLENASCAGCHKIMDPIGLALENFDGDGSFRSTENGVAIDTSGDLDGVKYDDAIGLAQAVHDNPGLPRCLVQRVYSYGTGGPTGISERDLLAYLNERFSSKEYRLRDLLRTIVLSDAFARIKEAQDPAPAEQAPGGEEPKITRTPAATATLGK